MNPYHVSVLLSESIEFLNIRPDGIYVDLTYGAGGHSRSILSRLNAKGHLYAFDQDSDAIANAIDDGRFTLIEANFRYFRRYLRLEGIGEADGILADLGVSSHQLDVPERGFSYRFDAPLDMRMNTRSEITAAWILRTYSEEKLTDILSRYGEVRNARTLAKALVTAAGTSGIRTTTDLNSVLDRHAMGPRQKYFSQVYQALRMEVNDEAGALCEMLEEGYRMLRPGGRFVVITFHSIEDRIVKNFFKTGNPDGAVVKDDFGNIHRPFRLINKNVVMAGNEEQRSNVRSRSAKLRAAEKL